MSAARQWKRGFALRCSWGSGGKEFEKVAESKKRRLKETRDLGLRAKFAIDGNGRVWMHY